MRETLYSVDKKGKIRTFKGEVSLTGPEQPNTAYVYTYTGVLGGKEKQSKETIKAGKQKRTINQQAEFVLDSAYKEKRDEGYKDIQQLRDQLLKLPTEMQVKHSLGATITDEVISLFNCLGHNGGTFNSNKDWYLLPMLAEKWRDYKHKVVYPVIIQPKLNGVRCLAFYSPIHKRVVLMSRGGEYYSVPHIEHALEPVLKENIGTMLDGELYKHGVPLQVISGACRLESSMLIDGRQDFLEYHVYDFPVIGIDQKSRDEARLSFLAIHFPNNKTIKKVISEIVLNEERVMFYHNKWVAEGYEGCMVRDISAQYMFSFRDYCLLKVKNYIDEEFEILGCEADNHTEETIAESFVFVVKNNTDDQEFKARPTGTAKMKLFWYNNIDKYIGKKATVRFQERATSGLPIQGHVRAKETALLMEAIRDYE